MSPCPLLGLTFPTSDTRTLLLQQPGRQAQLAQSLTCYVTVGASSPLSEPWCSHLFNGDVDISPATTQSGSESEVVMGKPTWHIWGWTSLWTPHPHPLSTPQ